MFTIWEKNVYFDKDGIVVESSDQEIEGVPLIKGLTFDRLTMHQALNVKDASIFGTILNIYPASGQIRTETGRDPLWK